MTTSQIAAFELSRIKNGNRMVNGKLSTYSTRMHSANQKDASSPKLFNPAKAAKKEDHLFNLIALVLIIAAVYVRVFIL